MQAEASGAEPAGVAARLLAKQERLVGWQIASERAGVTLKAMTGLAGLATAVLLAVMAWQASRADGMVIEPLSVPPDIAARGLTGEAAAAQLADHLKTIEISTRAGTNLRQVVPNAGHRVTLEIPQTGVSLDQVEQWLRDRLGRQVRLTGELVKDADGQLTLTARLGATPLPVRRGSDAAALLLQTAEAVYAQDLTGPFAGYLARQGRFQERAAWDRQRMQSPDPKVQARAWQSFANGRLVEEGAESATRALRIALSLDRSVTAGPANTLASLERQAGRREAAYRLWVESGQRARIDPTLTAAGREAIRTANQGVLATLRHDHLTALRNRQAFFQSGAPGFPAPTREILASCYAPLHERTRALREQEIDRVANAPWPAWRRAELALTLKDWPAVLVAAEEAAGAAAAEPDKGVHNHIWRWHKAAAQAQLGRLAQAQALIAPSPLDCEPCVRARGLIAAKGGNARLADHWYGEASKMAPSLADADFEWAEALAARGAYAKALARLSVAQRRTPRWADPRELEAEILLAQGDDRAAKKFAEAAKLAPRWGRLHLKWGDALAAQGKADAAQAKWRAAAGMDLSPADRARVTALLAGRRA
jgi:Tfp pilus assembly protein PilF